MKDSVSYFEELKTFSICSLKNGLYPYPRPSREGRVYANWFLELCTKFGLKYQSWPRLNGSCRFGNICAFHTWDQWIQLRGVKPINYPFLAFSLYIHQPRSKINWEILTIALFVQTDRNWLVYTCFCTDNHIHVEVPVQGQSVTALYCTVLAGRYLEDSATWRHCAM